MKTITLFETRDAVERLMTRGSEVYLKVGTAKAKRITLRQSAAWLRSCYGRMNQGLGSLSGDLTKWLGLLSARLPA